MRRATIFLITSLLFLLIIACGSGAQSSAIPATSTAKSTDIPAVLATNIPTAEPTTLPTVEPTANPNTTIGQEINVNGVQWKVIEAKDAGNTLTRDKNGVKNYANAKAQGKFIWVRYEVKMIQGGAQLTKNHIQVVDGNDNVYKGHDSLEAIERMQLIRWLPEEEWCPRDQSGFSVMQIALKQGESLICQDVFDVPADATNVKVRVSDLAIIGKTYAFIDLGF